MHNPLLSSSLALVVLCTNTLSLNNLDDFVLHGELSDLSGSDNAEIFNGADPDISKQNSAFVFPKQQGTVVSSTNLDQPLINAVGNSPGNSVQPRNEIKKFPKTWLQAEPYPPFECNGIIRGSACCLEGFVCCVWWTLMEELCKRGIGTWTRCEGIWATPEAKGIDCVPGKKTRPIYDPVPGQYPDEEWELDEDMNPETQNPITKIPPKEKLVPRPGYDTPSPASPDMCTLDRRVRFRKRADRELC